MTFKYYTSYNKEEINYPSKIHDWKKFGKNNPRNTGLKSFNDSKAFIEYSSNIDHIYKNIEE